MISTFDKAVFLKNIDIFSTTNTDELLRIAEVAEEVNFREGQSLFSEGENADSFYLIVEGRVEIRRGGKALMTALSKTPVGVLPLLAGHNHPVTAVAKSDTQALRISSVDFMDLLSDNDRVSREVIRALTVRLMEALTSRDAKDDSGPQSQ